jgi:hypothetical protein
MEVVFPPGIFRIFSDDFRVNPSGKHRNLSEYTEKKPENSRPDTASNFLVFSIASRPFPAICRSPGYVYLTEALQARLEGGQKIVQKSCRHSKPLLFDDFDEEN